MVNRFFETDKLSFPLILFTPPVKLTCLQESIPQSLLYVYFWVMVVLYCLNCIFGISFLCLGHLFFSRGGVVISCLFHLPIFTVSAHPSPDISLQHLCWWPWNPFSLRIVHSSQQWCCYPLHHIWQLIIIAERVKQILVIKNIDFEVR